MENYRWGKRIRAFRKLKRIQQMEFAKRIGISTTVLGNIERGQRVPSQELLDKMARQLDIDVNELIGEGIYRPIVKEEDTSD